MDAQKLKVVGETIEQTSRLADLLVKAEASMQNGEIMDAQKYTRESQALMSFVLKDTFPEFRSAFELNIDDANEIGDLIIGSLTLELIDLHLNLGTLLTLVADSISGSVFDSVINKVAKNINTIIILNNSIFAN